MGSKIPGIKKKVSAFLVGEEGKISRDSILKAGIMLGAVGISSAALSQSGAAQATHVNNILASYNSGTATISGTHTHHGSHSSHGSHGSHSSHASHGSHGSGGWC